MPPVDLRVVSLTLGDMGGMGACLEGSGGSSLVAAGGCEGGSTVVGWELRPGSSCCEEGARARSGEDVTQVWMWFGLPRRVLCLVG